MSSHQNSLNLSLSRTTPNCFVSRGGRNLEKVHAGKKHRGEITFWDNLRFIWHGKFCMDVQKFVFKLLTNTSPYISDALEVAIHQLTISYENGKIKIEIYDL
jgi:hypothetical protein